MIKKITLFFLFLILPTQTGFNCLSNYKGIEFVGWHSVECYCPCTYIKGRKCVECGHLQDARPLTVTSNNLKKLTPNGKIEQPQTIKNALANLIQRYIKK